MQIGYGKNLDWLRRLVRRQAADNGRALPMASRIGPDALAEALKGPCPPVLVDIRSPEVFAAGHLPGAVNVPLGELGRAGECLDSGAPTVAY